MERKKGPHAPTLMMDHRVAFECNQLFSVHPPSPESPLHRLMGLTGFGLEVFFGGLFVMQVTL